MAVRLMMMSRVIAAAAVVLLAGCASQQAPEAGGNVELPGTRVDSPEGYPAQLTWLPDGWIYFKAVPADSGKESELWRAKPGGKAERVAVPDSSVCRITRWTGLHDLPDGRLGMVRQCLTDDPTKDYADLVAFAPASGKVEVLVNLGRTFASSATWASSLKTGYAAKSDTVCASIVALTTAGLGSFPGPTEIDGHTWKFDAGITRPNSEKCDDDGRVGNPVLLGDDRTLLMLASPDSQGRSGSNRTQTDWNIYRWTPGSGAPSVVAKGFGDPNVMKVVAGERLAVLSANRAGKRGVWVVDLSTGKVKEIASGNAQAAAVSPDGKEIAVIFQPNTGVAGKDLYQRQIRLLAMPAMS